MRGLNDERRNFLLQVRHGPSKGKAQGEPDADGQEDVVECHADVKADHDADHDADGFMRFYGHDLSGRTRAAFTLLPRRR